MTEAIAVSALRKSYGKTVALDGLELSVAEGEVHGFLGPNGAGKTTTIRVLLGLLHADGGTARLLGGDPWSDATALHRRLAYVPGDVTLWPNLTGGEVIDLLGRLRGGIDAKRRASLLERFDLDPTKKARAYSKGNRQKVALIAALASDVELLILDEPTSGLDPLMEATFRECIEEEAGGGRTVLLSSHILSEVEALCERVTIIRAGRTVESGTLAAMRHLTRTSIAADLARKPADLGASPACTTSTCRTSPGLAPAGSARGCGARWTATSWTRCCAGWPTPACSAWSASRPRWRNCSCGTTRPTASRSKVPRHELARRFAAPGQAGRAAGPDHAAGLDLRACGADGEHRLQLQEALQDAAVPRSGLLGHRSRPDRARAGRAAVRQFGRRADRVQVRRDLRARRGPDEHLHRDPAHQGRRGVGPAGADRLDRGWTASPARRRGAARGSRQLRARTADGRRARRNRPAGRRRVRDRPRRRHVWPGLRRRRRGHGAAFRERTGRAGDSDLRARRVLPRHVCRGGGRFARRDALAALGLADRLGDPGSGLCG